MRRKLIHKLQQLYFVPRNALWGAATKIKENADDILADSKKINEERAAAEEVIEDAVGETA